MTTSSLTYPIRGDKLSTSVEVLEVLCDHQSEFQRIEILSTEAFGKMLLLDGHIQLTELDERAYHEQLVHVPLLNIPKPKRALVVGGGDGGAIRELCRNATIEHIDMVEIDSAVIDCCQRHFPLNQGAFENPKVHLHVADAFEFVKSALGNYDLIVMDSTDTYEGEDGNLSEMLFTRNFFEDCSKLLAPGGLVITQADNLLFCPYSLESIAKEYGAVFSKVGSYWGLVPSFGGYSGFCWASDSGAVSSSVPSQFPEYLTYLNPATYELGFQRLPFGS